MKQDLINHLLKNSGKLQDNETWYSLGVQFNIEAPKPKKAAKDKKYAKKSIGRKAQQYWQSYVNQKNRLQLIKETHKNGEVLFETYASKPKDIKIPNSEDFEIEKFTTNPYGGAWLKLKKKENFHTEEHLSKLKEILLQDLQPTKYRIPDVTNEKALFIYGADKHIGALTKLDSIYTNKYDREVMRERIVLKTLQNIQENVQLHGEFDSLYIMDLGDALDGFNAKTTGGLRGTSSHTLPQQLNNREQHDFYVEVHKELFDSIMACSFAKNVYFVATSNSNHGGDFEYGAMRHLEEYLNIKHPDIKTYVSYKAYNHFIYGKHCIVFGHGKDDEDMKNGLPLVLNDKVANVLADYIRVNKLEGYNISFISGDLHQSAETYSKNFRYKKVLSQYGSSKWMHTNFGSGAPGLCSEVYEKNSKKIYKEDNFFELENESNTGITF